MDQCGPHCQHLMPEWNAYFRRTSLVPTCCKCHHARPGPLLNNQPVERPAMHISNQAETLWVNFLHTHTWTIIVDAKTLHALRNRFERGQRLEAYSMTDNTWAVESQSNPGLAYRVSLGMNDCECTDFREGKAPYGWCKHLLATWCTKQLMDAPIEYPRLAASAPDPQEVADADLAEWEWVQETEARINGLY